MSTQPPLRFNSELDFALSPTRGGLPGNTRQESTRLGGWQRVRCTWRSSRLPTRIYVDDRHSIFHVVCGLGKSCNNRGGSC